jgi:NhaP-type Na+/H+ or K+/H+ antiporter
MGLYAHHLARGGTECLDSKKTASGLLILRFLVGLAVGFVLGWTCGIMLMALLVRHWLAEMAARTFNWWHT